MQPDLLINLIPGRVLALDGGNFSGRTSLLRLLTGLGEDGAIAASNAITKMERPGAYVGPEIYNSISGLTSTVQEELRLYTRHTSEEAAIAVLAEQVGLASLYARNPFTLSGGEQACLAFLCALAFRPSILGIDCALEQVEIDKKLRLLESIRNGVCPETATALADNELTECGEFTTIHRMPPVNGRKETITRYLRLEPINADIDIPISSIQPCRLTLKAVSFRYSQGPVVLRDVQIQLEPGTLYVLQGHNGAGKSTLAKLLCGVLRPDAGQILADHIEIQPWKRPGQVVAYHFQNPDVQLFATSVEEEIQASPRPPGSSAEEYLRRCEAIMDSFGLSHIRHEHPLDLPFVIRKRVALAATLAMGRPWLVLDEPTLGQDNTSSEAIARIISSLLNFGTGVMIVSHSLWFRQRFPANLLRLENGMLEQ